MAPKRVRFAIEEERCEDCSQTRRELRQQQRALDTALREQRIEAAQLQQALDELHACNLEKAELKARVVQLKHELTSARYEVEELESELELARRRKRQQDNEAAAAYAARMAKLGRRLVDSEAQVRASNAKLAKLQDEANRRSSLGGSHPGEDQQPQQQPQQPQQQPQQHHQQQQQGQPEGLPAGGATEAGAGSSGAATAEEPAAAQLAPGDAAPSGAGGSGAGVGAPVSTPGTSGGAAVLTDLRHGGPVAGQPAQERRAPSSETLPS